MKRKLNIFGKELSYAAPCAEKLAYAFYHFVMFAAGFKNMKGLYGPGL